MKKNFLQVFSLLMVIALMVITANAVVTDKPMISMGRATVTVYDQNVTVVVQLKVPKSYGIEGQWSTTVKGATNAIELAALDSTSAQFKTYGEMDKTTGLISWTDVNGEPSEWLTHPIEGEALSATYTIPKDTPAGSYTVTFTCTMFAGEKNGEITVTEEVYEYTGIIEVKQHACSDGATDGDHKCDDPLCGKDNVTEHNHNTYGKDGDSHWSICDDCGQVVENTDVPHTYDETTNKCVCGAEKPAAAGLKGDVNLDGVVNSDDLTQLARYVYVGDSLSETALVNADVNGDGKIDSDDITKHARYLYITGNWDQA